MATRGVVFAFASMIVVACNSSGQTSSAPIAQDAGADAAPRAPAPDPSTWRKTDSMKTARYAHTATLLADGKVVVVGGENIDHEMIAAVEIFDPAAETWAEGPSLPAPRSNHAAVRLDDGRVLVVGGGKNAPIGAPLGEGVTATALLYDPATGTFASVADMHHARSHVHAVLLRSGRVLVAGGSSETQESPASCGGALYCGPYGKALASAEIYDPKADTWTEVAPMTTARYLFSLTMLADGKAIAIGGVNGQAEGFPSTELYDPDADVWAAGPSLDEPREHHSAALLGTGRVIVAGGKDPNVRPLSSVRLFDPASSTFSKARNLTSARTLPGLVTLESGHALFVGGYDQLAQNAGESAQLDEARIYDDEAEAWTTIAPLSVARFWHTTTLLADGRVLVAGGLAPTRELASAEIGEP